MAASRFFVESTNASEYQTDALLIVDIGRDELRHATKVLRLRAGEPIELVVRDVWTAWSCVIESIDDHGLSVRVVEELPSAERPYQVTLFYGLAKGDKNETIVRQAVEVGVWKVQPVMFRRSVVKLDESRKAKLERRLQAISYAAAQQAHRVHIPEVGSIATFKDALQQMKDLDAVFVLWEEFDGDSLLERVEGISETLSRDARIGVVVGPEGGIDAAEIESLKEVGSLLGSLGPTILRVETACVVAPAIALAALDRALGDA